MKSSFKPYWAQLISLSLMATVAGGCGKKKKDDDSDSASAPDTEITAVESSEDGKTVTVMYREKSDAKDATFKCQVEDAKAEKGSAEWTDCDSAGLIVDVSPEARYTFRVKAIAGGLEDATPASRVYVAKGTPSDDPKDAQKIAALILNKADVGATYTKDTLSLNLGVNAQVNLDDIRFEYKLNDGQWTRVDADVLKLTGLEDGKTYALAVRAVQRSTNAISSEDSLSFAVKMDGLLSVKATPDLTTATSGTAQLSLAASKGEIASLTCALDGQAVDCSQYVPTLDIGAATAGSHRLVIQAADASGKSLGSSTVNFCSQTCATSGQPVQPTPQTLMLGDFYSFTVPPSMHVTEYATTKNWSAGGAAALEFYRIRTNSDPFYIGNYRCDGQFDMIRSSRSPSGNVNDYCYSTLPRTNNDEYYKWLTSYGLANNHMEVVTDADQIDPNTHERIILNVFDRDYEFMHGRSRFEQLCMNQRGRIIETPNIVWIDNFWTEWVRARMVICQKKFSNGLEGFDPEYYNNNWWIGAFFIDTAGQDLPRYECFWNNWQYDMQHGSPVDYHPEFCGSFKNPSLLEVTFISKRGYTTPEDFARAAQMRIRPLLKEEQPMLRH